MPSFSAAAGVSVSAASAVSLVSSVVVVVVPLLPPQPAITAAAIRTAKRPIKREPRPRLPRMRQNLPRPFPEGVSLFHPSSRILDGREYNNFSRLRKENSYEVDERRARRRRGSRPGRPPRAPRELDRAS